MAKVHGTIRFRDGGAMAGAVGDLPIRDAIAVITEGRLKTDYNPPLFAGDIETLLAGLDVESLSELRRLVGIGKLATSAPGYVGDASDEAITSEQDLLRRYVLAKQGVIAEWSSDFTGDLGALRAAASSYAAWRGLTVDDDWFAD